MKEKKLRLKAQRIYFFNKIIEEKFLNLKKEMHINVDEAYKIPIDRIRQ